MQFKIQYQLRIKGPKTKCIKTLGLLLVLAPHCGTLYSSFIYQEYSILSVQGFKQALKTRDRVNAEIVLCYTSKMQKMRHQNLNVSKNARC